MLYDYALPRHLPHLTNAEILSMGLSPLDSTAWIEPDTGARQFYDNKLVQRQELGRGAYRSDEASLPAQNELYTRLRDYLLREHPDCYQPAPDGIKNLAGDFEVADSSEEPLWQAAQWIADDLVLMLPRDDSYYLAAASLSSASDWRLEDKFGGSLADIHAVIPGFNTTLLPRVERFFRHLRVEHPVQRYNWGLQEGATLNRRDQHIGDALADAELYYRVERQSLRRLPVSGAIVFTIRVYLHRLEALRHFGDALPVLLQAIDDSPAELYRYKGFHRLEAPLARYRDSLDTTPEQT